MAVTYNIDYIVSMVMANMGETDTKNKQRYLNFAIQGYRRLNLAGVMPTAKSVLLDIDPNTNTASLPQDYIDYIKIGLCIGCNDGNGRFVNLTYNPDICNTAQLEGQHFCTDCQESITTDIENVGCCNTNGLDTWWYNPYWYGGVFYGGFYGYGAGNYRGGYNIFLEQRLIAFDSYISGEKVILEYKSNGINGIDTIVPEGVIGVLTSWVAYQAVLWDKNRASRLDVNPFYQNFVNEWRGFKARNASMTLHDWKQTYYNSIKQTVKR